MLFSPLNKEQDLTCGAEKIHAEKNVDNEMFILPLLVMLLLLEGTLCFWNICHDSNNNKYKLFQDKRHT